MPKGLKDVPVFKALLFLTSLLFFATLMALLIIRLHNPLFRVLQLFNAGFVY